GARHIDVQREGRELAVLLDPSGPPAEIGRKAPSGLAAEDFAVAAFEADDIAGDRLRARRRTELALCQARDEPSLLDRADLERTIEPERVDDGPRLLVAKIQTRQPDLVAFEPDTTRQLLIDGHRGQRDGLTHRHVPFPLLERLRLAAIGNDL